MLFVKSCSKNLTKFFLWLSKVCDQVFKASDHFRQVDNFEEARMSLAGCHVIQAPKMKKKRKNVNRYFMKNGLLNCFIRVIPNYVL